MPPRIKTIAHIFVVVSFLSAIPATSVGMLDALAPKTPDGVDGIPELPAGMSVALGTIGATFVGLLAMVGFCVGVAVDFIAVGTGIAVGVLVGTGVGVAVGRITVSVCSV